MRDRSGMCRIVTLMALAAVALSPGCASRGAAGGAVPQPFPQPGPPAGRPPAFTAPASAGAADGYAIAGTALALRGVPYRNGGSDPTGFDCSGLVWYVFTQHGIAAPRTVSDQFRAGASVGLNALQPGDLVFFNTKGSGATHVGMVIGGDEFVHAPSSRGEVRVERLGSSYWSARFVGARRFGA